MRWGGWVEAYEDDLLGEGTTFPSTCVLFFCGESGPSARRRARAASALLPRLPVLQLTGVAVDGGGDWTGEEEEEDDDGVTYSCGGLLLTIPSSSSWRRDEKGDASPASSPIEAELFATLRKTAEEEEEEGGEECDSSSWPNSGTFLLVPLPNELLPSSS